MTNANIELSFFSELDLNELHLFIAATVEHSYKDIYAREAIDFFLSYLDKNDILKESKDHPIIVLREEGKIVGTATLIERHVKRLFVEPSCQGKGYGRLLMEKLEVIAVRNKHSFIELHSSLFAKRFYDNLSYLTFKIDSIPVKNGQLLTYYRMAKFLMGNGSSSQLGIDGKCFVIDTPSEKKPLFPIGTKFVFYQQENLIFCEYSNKYVKDGEMFGAFHDNSKLLYYNHINKDNGNNESGVFNFKIVRNDIRLYLLDYFNLSITSELAEYLLLKPCL